MPITAKFQADFTDFYAATKKAETSLDNLGAATEKSRGFIGGLAGSLGQFDRIFASAGVNIGSTVSALNEMSSAVGKTTTELGLFTTAGIAAGTAMGAYGLTRSLLEATGAAAALDGAFKKVGEQIMFTGAALDAAQLGAKQDVLNRATENAGRLITDYSEAIRINNEAARQHSLTLDTATRRIQGYEAQLEKVAKSGNWAQLTEDMNSNVFTQKEIAARYGISVEAVEHLTRTEKANADAAKEQAKQRQQDLKDENADVQKLFKAWEDGDKLMQEFAITTHKTAMDEMRKEREERASMLKERNTQVLDGLKQIQSIEAEYTDFIQKQTLSETDYKILKIHEWEKAQLDAFKGTEEEMIRFTEIVTKRAQQQIDALQEIPPIVTLIGHTAAEVEAARKAGAKETGDVVTDEFKRQQAAFESFKGVVVAGTGEIVAASYAVQTAMAGTDVVTRDWAIRQAQMERGEIFLTGMSSGRIPIRTRQTGGPVDVGQTYLVGERGPELLKPASAGKILTTTQAGGVTMYNTLNVNGSVRDIAPQLVAELTRLMKLTRQWPSA